MVAENLLVGVMAVAGQGIAIIVMVDIANLVITISVADGVIGVDICRNVFFVTHTVISAIVAHIVRTKQCAMNVPMIIIIARVVQHIQNIFIIVLI